MAPFNPDVQKVQEPSYMGLSQPISQPEANKTTASLIKGFGDTLSAAFQGVDATFKAHINDKIYRGYDPIVQGNIKAVEEYTTSGKAVATESLAAVPESIPEGVSDGIENITAAQAGYDSTASRTLKAQYRKDIYTVAKDLRAQFPGYRDYIDTKIGEVVARDPANRYYEQTLQLLNKQVQDANREHNMALRMVQQNMGIAGDPTRPNMPGSAAVLKKVQNKEWGLAEVGEWLNYHKTIERNLDLDSKIAANENASIDLKAKKTDSYITGQLNFQASNFFENIRISLPNSKPGSGFTAKSIYDSVQGALIGQGPAPSGDQLIQWKQMVQAGKSQVVMQMEQWGRTKGADGLTPIERLGSEGQKKWNAKIADATELWTRLERMVSKEDIPLLGTTAVRVEALKQDYQTNIIKDPGWKQWFLANDWIRQNFPAGYGNWTQQFLGSGMSDRLGAHLMDTHVNMLTDNKRVDTPPGPQSYSFNDGVGAMQSVPAHINEYRPEHYEHTVKLVNTISQPGWSDNSKLKMMWAAYGPRNNGFLNRFERDSVDAKGNPINGKFGVFETFTAKDKMAEVERLSSFDPRIKPQAIKWSTDEFMRVYTQEVRNLNDIEANPAFKLSYGVNSVTGEPQFVLQHKPLKATEDVQRYKYAVDNREFSQYKISVDNLNKGLRGLKNVADLGGFKPTEYVLSQLIENGYTPKPGSEAEKLLKTMIDNVAAESSQDASGSQNKGRGSDKTSQPRGSKGQKDESTRSEYTSTQNSNPTLGEWLANPGGIQAEPIAAKRVKTQSFRKPQPTVVEEREVPGSFRVEDNPQGLSPRQLDQQRRNK